MPCRAVPILLLLVTPAVAQVPIRIMPLGDSITEAEAGHASYRYWLWHALNGAGYTVDLVGQSSGVYNGAPLYANFDQDHEGHWGWRADQILAQIALWTPLSQPDIVLMHLGTNDIWQGQSLASTIAELDSIVQLIRMTNPAIIVVIAQIIPGNSPQLASIPAYNALIPGLAALLSTPQSPVTVVDQYSGFDATTQTYDGVHPSESGERQMAGRWLEALAPHLGPFRLGIWTEVVTGDGVLRNLAGPSTHDYFTAISLDPANAGPGLGTGWFAGLHVTLPDVVVQYLSGAPPFRGALNVRGASATFVPASALAPASGATFYAVSHAIDPATGVFSAVSTVIAYTIP